MIRLPVARPGPAAGLAAATLVLLWAAGFAWFLRATRAEPPPPPPADGIVALTGGAQRIEAAFRLLAAGRGQLLLVSGVGGATDFIPLARRAGVDPALEPRVTLGRAALTTRGNATETADWVHENRIRSLIVVTADYHMPRALAELTRALPGVALYPAPVRSAAPREGTDAATLRRLAGEYTKWLAAELGLTALDPHPPLRTGVERESGG